MFVWNYLDRPFHIVVLVFARLVAVESVVKCGLDFGFRLRILR